MVLNKKLNIPSVFELLKVILNKDEWRFKSPYQKWCHFYGVGKACTSLIKFTTFQEDQTLCWFSYFPVVYLIIHFMLVMYTIIYCVLHGDLSNCLSCTCLFIGPVCATIPILYGVLSKTRFGYHAAMAFGGKHIYPIAIDENIDVKYYSICSQQIDSSIRNGCTKMGIILLSACVVCIGPAYAFLCDGTKTTLTDVRIPFTEKNSYAEFLGNIILQCIISTHGMLGYVGVEVAVGVCHDTIALMPQIVAYHLDSLDKSIEEDQFNQIELLLKFKNIVKQTLDFDRYIICLRNLFYYRTFLAPVVFTYSMGMSIFCHYTMNFASGYGLAVTSWVQLFYLCEVGEEMEDNNLADTLYDSNWYALPIKRQIDIMHLINIQQNGPTIKVGPYVPLNRVLFNVITSKVYSFVMFLLNFTSP